MQFQLCPSKLTLTQLWHTDHILLSIGLYITRCITAIPSPVPFLPLVVPVIVSRFTSQEECEPSEEIRLDLVESLNLFIDASGIDIAPYTHDFITILRISVIDPYPEVKKVWDWY